MSRSRQIVKARQQFEDSILNLALYANRQTNVMKLRNEILDQYDKLIEAFE